MHTQNHHSGHVVHQRERGRGTRWADYLPLLVLLAMAALAGAAKQAHYGHWITMSWMLDFMGFFLVIFAMLKLFDLPEFADGFQMYDLLAKPFRPYAYMYPFIELALGLAYLARWRPEVLYAVTVVVLVFGAAGVLRALAKGLDVECACMGTVLHVPLSTVALVEDLGMAAMAAYLLWAIW